MWFGYPYIYHIIMCFLITDVTEEGCSPPGSAQVSADGVLFSPGFTGGLIPADANCDWSFTAPYGKASQLLRQTY